jgi:hypothetical protein
MKVKTKKKSKKLDEALLHLKKLRELGFLNKMNDIQIDKACYKLLNTKDAIITHNSR